jgi:hypothetical protein
VRRRRAGRASGRRKRPNFSKGFPHFSKENPSFFQIFPKKFQGISLAVFNDINRLSADSSLRAKRSNPDLGIAAAA